MKELIPYLVANMVLDFKGDVSMETVRRILSEDDGPEARRLLAKLLEDKGVDEMLITLADCLKEHVAAGISERVVREQIMLYADS